MGDPKKQGKKYETPKKMWDKAKVEERRKLTENYGLKNKKELWKAETILRKKRQNARKLLALPIEKRKKREKELLDSLVSLGVLKKNASLDDVLSLKIESLLERRLQSIVWRQGLSGTISQARQLITHGHIGVNGKKVTAPGYLVKKSEEQKIGFLDKAMELKIKQSLQKKKAPREKRRERQHALGALKEMPPEKKIEEPGKEEEKPRETKEKKKKTEEKSKASTESEEKEKKETENAEGEKK